MAWFKVDDRLWAHPKFIGLPLAAVGLWVKAGSYCAAYETDGALPSTMVRTLGGQKRDSDRLVDAGLWHRTEDGFTFHNWDEFQPTKAQLEAERRKTRERQQEWRDKNKKTANAPQTNAGRTADAQRTHAGRTADAQQRHNGSRPDNASVVSMNGEIPTETQDRNGVTNTGSNGVSADAPTRPDPTRPLNTPIVPRKRGTYEEDFARFWDAYPTARKAAKRQCATKFAKAVKDGVDPERIIAAAEQYNADPNRTDQYTAAPLTWLNQERWEASPLPARGNATARPRAEQWLQAGADLEAHYSDPWAGRYLEAGGM